MAAPNLAEHARPFGADPERLRLLSDTGPALLPYATLLLARRGTRREALAREAVYEWQGRPLVFLADASLAENDVDVRRLRRQLALRGDIPYLGLIEPGRLTLHTVGLDARLPKDFVFLTVRREDEHAGVTLARLAAGDFTPDGHAAHVTRTLLSLIESSISELTEPLAPHVDEGAAALCAISLVGRAVFTRFLGDRDLLPDERAARSGALFRSARAARDTSAWLDATFNGDFLPLHGIRWNTVPSSVWGSLTNVMLRAPGGQLHLGWNESWRDLDFAHVPVGVLSQAYEAYSRRHDPLHQRKHGVYYTPATVAERVVAEAFAALRRAGKAHTARVLDPAVGAGVFLLTAYRRLVAERWSHSARRPTTRTLRTILDRQLTGFDISEEALRLTALGLYLLAIELDPQPKPVERLRFNNLRGRVLFNVGSRTARSSAGSLGPAVSDEHDGCYDLVIGNPPWTGSTSFADDEWALVAESLRRVAQTRATGQEITIPNRVQDLPFVWRAMRWAGEGAQIAMVLHARILFHQGDGMPIARRQLFDALDVTGIVNGADLRFSNVWPGVKAPFCLLFATNRAPGPASVCRYVSPRAESINGRGALRIDALTAPLVNLAQLRDQPHLFKVLYRGTELDLQLLTRMRDVLPLREYWRRLFGHHARDPSIYEAPLLLIRESPPAGDARIAVSTALDPIAYNQSFHGFSAHGHPAAVPLVRYLALLFSSRVAFWYLLVTSGRFGVDRPIVEKAAFEELPVVPLEDLPSDLAAEAEQLFDTVARRASPDAWAQVDAWASRVFGLEPGDMEVIDSTLAYGLPFDRVVRAAQEPATAAQRETFLATLRGALAGWADDEGLELSCAIEDVPKAPWHVLSLRGQLRAERPSERAAKPGWEALIRLADGLGATEVYLPAPAERTVRVARLRAARHWTTSAARLCAQYVLWNHFDALGGDLESGVGGMVG